jgi:hypothetical protein
MDPQFILSAVVQLLGVEEEHIVNVYQWGSTLFGLFNLLL